MVLIGPTKNYENFMDGIYMILISGKINGTWFGVS